MYVPKHFAEDRLAVLHEAIGANPFGTIVTVGPDGPVASHVPMLLDAKAGERGVLHGHLARANGQARPSGPNFEALAIFQGPHAYITPNWYATKHETGKVVPTWNYIAVHAHGPVSFFNDADRLLDLVCRLTDRHEKTDPAPWAVSDAPETYVQSMLRAIVGFEMPISRIDGQWKLSQNRPDADKTGIVAGLTASMGTGALILQETRRALGRSESDER